MYVDSGGDVSDLLSENPLSRNVEYIDFLYGFGIRFNSNKVWSRYRIYADYRGRSERTGINAAQINGGGSSNGVGMGQGVVNDSYVMIENGGVDEDGGSGDEKSVEDE